jgi:hypothetical protein
MQNFILRNFFIRLVLATFMASRVINGTVHTSCRVIALHYVYVASSQGVAENVTQLCNSRLPDLVLVGSNVDILLIGHEVTVAHVAVTGMMQCVSFVSVTERFITDVLTGWAGICALMDLRRIG